MSPVGSTRPSVLLISHFYPPESVGGVEVLTEAYALELVRRGYRVQVLAAGTWEGAPSDRPGVRDSDERGVSVRRIDLDWRSSSDPNRALYENDAIGSCLEEWLPDWEPDLVHVTSCYTLSLSILESTLTQAGPQAPLFHPKPPDSKKPDTGTLGQ